MRELDHRLSATELMLLNCSPREDSWESLGQQRRSNQSILKEINPEYSFEGLIWSWSSNTLATWLWRAYSLKKTLMLGKNWRQKEKGVTEDEMVGWHHWLSGHEFEQTLGQSRGQRSLACCSHGVAKSRTRLSDWTKNTLQPIHSNKFSGLV